MASDTSTTRTHDGTPAPARGLPRPLLWALLAAALVVNVLTSFLAWPLAVGIASGVVVLASGGWLFRDHRRRARA
jgi:hypothetical protein